MLDWALNTSLFCEIIAWNYSERNTLSKIRGNIAPLLACICLYSFTLTKTVLYFRVHFVKTLNPNLGGPFSGSSCGGGREGCVKLPPV